MRPRARLGVAVLVYNVDVTGGMERQALRLAEELAARGSRVWLISTCTVPGWTPRLPPGKRFLERRGRLSIYRVPMCRGWLWHSCTELYEIAAAWLLARHAPSLDAIYAVQWTAGIHAARVARVLGCPFFVKLAGGGQNGDFAAIEREAAGPRALPALARAEGLVCISPQIAQEVRAAGLAADKVVAIPNGVDLARFRDARPATLPGAPDAERVLFVGALRREKRIPDLVRSFAAALRARPRARLVLAGDGPEEAAIRAAAREQGLEHRVDLLGRRTDVAALLKVADVFVLTSESEGLSNALLEAMAAGAPIVATDVEGNRAVVENEREALLVPLGDGDALARAIVRLLEDRALAARLVDAARRKVERYAIERVAAEYERVFRAAARPLPGSASLALRYFQGFGGLGLNGLARALVRQRYEPVVRRAISSVVVALKGAVGIEGDILRARGPDSSA